MQIHLFISLLHIYSITNAQYRPSLTPSDIDRLRIRALDLFDSFGNRDDPASMKPLLGSVVRLVFHDCAGPLNTGDDTSTIDNALRICDGCLDMTNAAHKGLEEFAVNPIEQICAEFSAQMNRADCWSALGTIALEYANSLSAKEERLPMIPYYIGRPECSLSPNAVTLSDTIFPTAHTGWDALFAFFEDFFGFDQSETAALMGAHTLGRAHKSESGYDGKWTENSFAFDNQFFVELLDASNQWDQTDIQKSGFPQWNNAGRLSEEEGLIMFNVDMSMIGDFEEKGDDGNPFIDETTGIVDCRLEGFELRSDDETICPREKTYNIAHRYAQRNHRFLNDFALVWEKMITNNYDLGALTKIIPNEFNVNILKSVTKPPTKNPILLQKITEEPNISIGDSSESVFCCHSRKIPNWNGRCWRNLNEKDCFDEPPANGKRCYWDIHNCRHEQTCLVRDEKCEKNKDCCSGRCRPDINACR